MRICSNSGTCGPSRRSRRAVASRTRRRGSPAHSRPSRASCRISRRCWGSSSSTAAGATSSCTDAGRALLDDARTLLADADAFATRAAAAADGRVGRLAIGFGGAAINSVLGPALGAFRRAHPDVDLRLVEHFDDLELSALVQRRVLDAAIVRFAAEGAGVAQGGDRGPALIAPSWPRTIRWRARSASR